jgi:hypothetical protein
LERSRESATIRFDDGENERRAGGNNGKTTRERSDDGANDDSFVRFRSSLAHKIPRFLHRRYSQRDKPAHAVMRSDVHR